MVLRHNIEERTSNVGKVREKEENKPKLKENAYLLKEENFETLFVS